MLFKSKYVLSYSIDDIKDELEIIATIRQKDGKIERNQNVYECVIDIDGTRIEKPEVMNYVNAKFAIDDIYNEYKSKLKQKCRAEGKKFRTINESFK